LKLSRKCQKESNREIRQSYRAAKKKLKEGYQSHTEYTALRFERSCKIIKVLSRVQEALQNQASVKNFQITESHNDQDLQALTECEDSAAWLQEFLFGVSGWPEECKRILINSGSIFTPDKICLGGFFEDNSNEEKENKNKLEPEMVDVSTQTRPSAPPGFEIFIKKSVGVEESCMVSEPKNEQINESPKSKISAPPGFERKDEPDQAEKTPPSRTPSRPPPGFNEQESSQNMSNSPFTTPPFLRKYTRDQLLHLCKPADKDVPPGLLKNYIDPFSVPFIPNPPGFPINHHCLLPFTQPILSAEAIPFQPYTQLPRSDLTIGQSGMYNKGSNKAEVDSKKLTNRENSQKEKNSSEKSLSELMPQRRRRRPGLESKNNDNALETKIDNVLDEKSSQIDPVTELWGQLEKNDDAKRTNSTFEFGLKKLLKKDKENWECSSQNATEERASSRMTNGTVPSFHSLPDEDITCVVVEESNLNPSANEFKI
jgi:hypothetical protein